MNPTLALTPGQALDLRIHRICKSDAPCPRSLAEVEQRTGMDYEHLKLASRRRHWLRVRHILKIKETITRWISFTELAQICGSDWRTVKEALKYTLEEVTLQLREVFRSSFMYQGTCREVGDVRQSNSQKFSFFASLSEKTAASGILKSICQVALGPIAATEMLNTAERSDAAKNKSGDAKRSLNLLSTNLETGEVIMQQRVWKPSPGNDKPPREFFAPFDPKEAQAKKSPIASESRTTDPEAPVPCPPEILEQMRELMQKMSSKRNDRYGKYQLEQAARNSKLSHLQRLELQRINGQIADDGWFRENKGAIGQLFYERDCRRERGEQ